MLVAGESTLCWLSCLLNCACIILFRDNHLQFGNWKDFGRFPDGHWVALLVGATAVLHSQRRWHHGLDAITLPYLHLAQLFWVVPAFAVRWRVWLPRVLHRNVSVSQSSACYGIQLSVCSNSMIPTQLAIALLLFAWCAWGFGNGASKWRHNLLFGLNGFSNDVWLQWANKIRWLWHLCGRMLAWNCSVKYGLLLLFASIARWLFAWDLLDDLFSNI